MLRRAGYIGASAGQGNQEVGTFDEADTAFKVFGGYRFIKFFGVEADYRDFGAPETQGVEVDSTAFDLWAVGVIPIANFELFGKAGVTSWESEITGQPDQDGSDLAYGVGAAWKISKIAVRLEFEMFDVDGDSGVDTDVNMATVGVDWRF